MKSVSDYLARSDYSSSLEKVTGENPSALTVSRVFYSKLVSRCYHLVRISSGPSRNLLEAYLERFLLEDLKRILRAKHAGGAVETSSLIVIPKGYDHHIDLKAISEASTLQDAIDLLKNTRFKGVTRLMPIYQKYGLISLIEAFIDKTYYDSEVIMSIGGVPDKSTIKDMIAIEVDLTVIKTLTDLKGRGVAAEAVRSIGFRPMKLKADELVLMLEGNSDSIPEILSRTRYADLSQPIRDALDAGKEESLDHVIRTEIHRRNKSLMIRYAATLAYVLGYVREAETEATNLVSIVTGKELGLPESKIEAALSV